MWKASAHVLENHGNSRTQVPRRSLPGRGGGKRVPTVRPSPCPLLLRRRVMKSAVSICVTVLSSCSPLRLPLRLCVQVLFLWPHSGHTVSRGEGRQDGRCVRLSEQLFSVDIKALSPSVTGTQSRVPGKGPRRGTHSSTLTQQPHMHKRSVFALEDRGTDP